jgi:hypothetical protein
VDWVEMHTLDHEIEENKNIKRPITIRQIQYPKKWLLSLLIPPKIIVVIGIAIETVSEYGSGQLQYAVRVVLI